MAAQCTMLDITRALSAILSGVSAVLCVVLAIPSRDEALGTRFSPLESHKIPFFEAFHNLTMMTK